MFSLIVPPLEKRSIFFIPQFRFLSVVRLSNNKITWCTLNGEVALNGSGNSLYVPLTKNKRFQFFFAKRKSKAKGNKGTSKLAQMFDKGLDGILLSTMTEISRGLSYSSYSGREAFKVEFARRQGDIQREATLAEKCNSDFTSISHAHDKKLVCLGR